MLREAKVGSERNSDHGTREYQAMRMAIQCKIIKKKQIDGDIEI
jgi:hypothetical protein